MKKLLVSLFSLRTSAPDGNIALRLADVFQTFLFSPSRAKSVILFALSLSFVTLTLFHLHAAPPPSASFPSASLVPPAPPPSFPTPAPAPPPLHGEHQEAGEGGVFPSSHQISSLQFQVRPVSLLHLDQNTVAGGLARHILVAGEGRNHRPAVVHQANLDRTGKGV